MLFIQATAPIATDKYAVADGHGSGHAEDKHIDETMQEMNKNSTTNTTWACETTDTCGPACAKYDKDCAAGQPELWFTYPEWASYLNTMKPYKKQIEAYPMAD